jgi:hypothetical protein
VDKAAFLQVRDNDELIINLNKAFSLEKTGKLKQPKEFLIFRFQILKDRSLFVETDFRPELDFLPLFICDFDAF